MKKLREKNPPFLVPTESLGRRNQMAGADILLLPNVPHYRCVPLGVSGRSECLVLSGFGTWPSYRLSGHRSCLVHAQKGMKEAPWLSWWWLPWVQPSGKPALSLCQPSHLSSPLWLPPISLGCHRGPAHLSSQRQVCLEQSRAGPWGGPGLHTTFLP